MIWQRNIRMFDSVLFTRFKAMPTPYHTLSLSGITERNVMSTALKKEMKIKKKQQQRFS